MEWTPYSWQNFPCKHQPVYPDDTKVQQVLAQLQKLPPLIFTGEIDSLEDQIAQAGQGQRFILQGGDCAERFIDCNDKAITSKLKILLQMSVILTYGARVPVTRIGRIAGQYAKPRSEEYEKVGEKKIPSYKGDLINGYAPIADSRMPDPERLLQGYFYAGTTLNYIRAMLKGGFADLHNPFQWNLHEIEKTNKWPEYKAFLNRILDSIDFIEALANTPIATLNTVDFFTSHEGLVLRYEQALTRPTRQEFYNAGAHMLWIGDRTRQLDGAHVEYFRGIRNPIGIKIGSFAKAETITELVKKLNPSNKWGRIVLITRFGADRVRNALPRIIEAILQENLRVTWCCDPMHGNTIKSWDGQKTRNFQAIQSEISQTFDIHREKGSYLGGIHFELTGDNVSECLGGAVNLRDQDLQRNYQTWCDPRLNYAQSLEMAFLLAQKLKGGNE